MARKGATTGQRRIYMPNMRDEGNPTTIQSRRDRKTVRSKQNSIGPSKKGDITFTITLSARIDEPSDNARPSPKRHDRNEGSSIRPTAMHRMADELKTSRRREHRWKLILWSPKNTKEEERKETIEQIKRWPKESHPEAIGAHNERSPNPHVQIASNFTRSHKT
ncbi:unnamed protein product [Microthlaspi erraticum]|uniref:Uncharacterized protein n=1 Tax=Microthlaspi erraticum TaxID=1685480 RepID=A0A6D2KGN4_9BRAS|nr:unnamed protein product [Microthlaspi erraticum]